MTARVFVAGTATEVGKTYCAAAVLRSLRRRGLRVAARKPTQSFAPGQGHTDAELLGEASGEDPDVVCPPAHAFPVPMAPPMAAEALGRPAPTLADLLAAATAPPGVALVLVEGAGGPRSPVAADADNVALAAALRPERVLLVSDAGLGAINAVRLSCAALGAAVAPERVLVLLNRFSPADDLHGRNRDWLRRDGLAVHTDAESVANALADVAES